MGHAKLFVGVLEDLPYAENRVLVDADDGDRLRFRYDISQRIAAAAPRSARRCARPSARIAPCSPALRPS